MPKARTLCLALSSALLLVACGKGEQTAAGGAPKMPPAEVAVVTVGQGQNAVTQDLPARLVAFRTAEVRARVEGILEKRLFAEGGVVQAGQSLFQIDSRTLEADLATARAALARSQASAMIAGQTATRYRQLISTQGVSKQELDQAEATLKQAEADVASNKAAVTRAELNLNYSRVLAPISGRIGRAFVTEGALVGKGDATLLATIEQTDPINVNFTQSGSELLRLKQQMRAGKLKAAQGVPVQLILSDGTVYPLQGKLSFAEQTVDTATGTVTMRAEFRNPDGLLLPGMFGTVRLAQGLLDQTIRVPQRAVMQSKQGSSVYVVDAEGKVAARPVKTGGFSGQDWIITSGLQSGDKVVVEGLQKTGPGAVVKPVPFGASAPVNASAPAASQPASASAAH
ncbi:MAG: efflux transporter periplasmic adaptor subunit [Proteobacteria bacterium]|nr:efflux transporter periplasmic adaptor subunit [Pseudomonadota bacterium]